MGPWLRRLLLALLMALLVGLAIGSWIRLRLERPPRYLGAHPQEVPAGTPVETRLAGT